MRLTVEDRSKPGNKSVLASRDPAPMKIDSDYDLFVEKIPKMGTAG